MFRAFAQTLKSQTRPQGIRGMSPHPAPPLPFLSSTSLTTSPSSITNLHQLHSQPTLSPQTLPRRGYKRRRDAQPSRSPPPPPPPPQPNHPQSSQQAPPAHNNTNNSHRSSGESRRVLNQQRDAEYRTHEEQLRFDQNHLRPDTLAYVKQNQSQLFQNVRPLNPGNPGYDPKAGMVIPTAAEFAARQEGMRAKFNIIQKLKFEHPLTRPMRAEEDLPMIIDTNDPKQPPQLFLPRSTYPMFRIWDVPDTIPMPRKDAVVPFLVYTGIGLIVALIAGLPIVIDRTKDAEKKHLILQTEVTNENKQLDFLKCNMTLAEISQAFEKLPREPGVTWNPDEEAEMERLQKRIYYPQ